MQLFGYYPFEQMRKVFQGEFGVSKLPSGGLEIRFFSMVITISSSGLKFKLGADEVDLNGVGTVAVLGGAAEVKVSDIKKRDYIFNTVNTLGGLYDTTLNKLKFVNDTDAAVLRGRWNQTGNPATLNAGATVTLSMTYSTTTYHIHYDAVNNVILY